LTRHYNAPSLIAGNPATLDQIWDVIDEPSLTSGAGGFVVFGRKVRKGFGGFLNVWTVFENNGFSNLYCLENIALSYVIRSSY
ncbi:hypothetical protein, partial [Arthrobacter sp.]|uniref:hypothetical protein n=1 Tax=Arthrobacter sp. TaxID=1667 RepID=UPI00281224BC